MPLLITNGITDGLSSSESLRVEKILHDHALTITYGIIDRLSPLKSSKELELNYITLPLIITDRITNGLSPLESSRVLEKKYMTLPLTVTDGITDGLSSLESSRELEKITRFCR
jgi:hypothetical protein